MAADGAAGEPEDPKHDVIAPPPARRHRAGVFEGWLLIALATFTTLALAAHVVPYFSVDLEVTRAIQRLPGTWFEHAMWAVSWPGFPPQAFLLVGAIVGALWLAGLRWEAVCTLLASLGVFVGTGVKLLVFRPRPAATLVHVFKALPPSSFPSGHVLMFTCLAGFLAFLAFTLLKPRAARIAAIVVAVLVMLLMGLSRIALGHHWLSDVSGGYVLGGLWLTLVVRVYRWGKPRFFAHQPAAPGASSARA